MVNLARDDGQGGEVVFPSGEDVDVFTLFEVIGVLEVDDGSIINYEGGRCLFSSATEILFVLTFEGGDFVFNATSGGANEVDEAHPSRAKVECIDGTNWVVVTFFIAGIMAGVSDMMTVASPDFHLV